MNVIRAISGEGFGRIAYNKTILMHLNSGTKFRDYFEQETTELPQFYKDVIKNDLGPLERWLPEEAIFHDHKAYLKTMPKRIAV
jgi:hypothetical protein